MGTISTTISTNIYYGSGQQYPLTITNSGAVILSSTTPSAAVQGAGGGAAATSVRIVSRAAAHQELGLARDPRVLGVAIRWVAIAQGARCKIIGADSELLDVGFHCFEADNGFRWTDSDAVIPIDALPRCAGPVEIVLTVASTMRYPEERFRLQVA